ncbi:MAG: DUF4369 domain-containing protein [Prevotella sp.]|nr:DUF4369 domain-containing protein [Prevotella sp.]
MNKLSYSFFVLAALVVYSCAEQYTESYNIQGSSSVSVLDGSKLYLKVMMGDDIKNIDSCEVVHGSFGFTGKLDTTRLAMLSVAESGIPIVIEKGDILVNIDKTGHKVSGSPMNDMLYEYLDKLIQLQNQRGELGHKQIQMLLEGVDEQTIVSKLSVEEGVLLAQIDSLETCFILANLDNVLGPCAFQILTSGFPYPVLTPQIEEIMGKASDKFKNDRYVREYYGKAKEILSRMKGEIDDSSAVGAAAEAK